MGNSNTTLLIRLEKFLTMILIKLENLITIIIKRWKCYHWDCHNVAELNNHNLNNQNINNHDEKIKKHKIPKKPSEPNHNRSLNWSPNRKLKMKYSWIQNDTDLGDQNKIPRNSFRKVNLCSTMWPRSKLREQYFLNPWCMLYMNWITMHCN